MDHSDSTTLVDVQKVDIDHVNVTGSAKSSVAQMWTALTPVLTVLITAVSIVVTLCFQMYQAHQESRQKDDSDWRSSLEKVSVDNTTSAIGTFEMMSFLGGNRYRPQARSIASAVLPSVRDRYEFDVAFSLLLKDTDRDTQADVITVAYNISHDLRTLYSTARKQLQDDPDRKDVTLQQFALDPTEYLDDGVNTPEQIEAADTERWELDTVIKGLSTLWLRNKRGFAVPKDAELDRIIFVNGDFHGVDFREASMSDAYFVGRCSVANTKFPKEAPAVECQSPDH